ncbi:MAG TPA: phospholipid carrier-dependent glycosyltransferase, partial [Planctomycetota bacterium]|nr:phospholipid carrier-dependent glycosyltransferase [Planctomycetota bacterium]
MIVAHAPRWAAPLLALIACLLVASTWPVFGHIWDEPEHIAVGLALIDHNEYLYDDQHPPLARLAAAIGPHLAGARAPADTGQGAGFNGEEAGRQILYHSSASYDRLLTLARLGMLPFLVVLIFAVWQWAWRYHGAAVAWLASAFLLSTPAILGHAGVVALDVPVTALCTLSFYLLVRWLESPSLGRAALLGLAVGLAVSTKLSALPFIGVAGLALLAAQLLCTPRAGPHPPLGRRVGGAMIALLIALLTVIAVYGP